MQILAECTQKVFEIALERFKSHYVCFLFVNKWWKKRIFTSYLELYSISYTKKKDGLFKKNNLYCLYTGFKKWFAKISSYVHFIINTKIMSQNAILFEGKWTKWQV